jgi:hypothetical protein
MNETVAIGKSAYGRQGGFGGGFFHIEANKDNVYRVLPAMKTLAATGQYAKYYRTHRGFRGTDNGQKPFICPQEQDYKTKVIKVHCPVCDIVDQMEKELETWPSKGATKEQIKEFRDKNIWPFQSEGKYYLNVVNTEGKIGILPIGSKSFKALEALAKEQEAKGRDITGIEGVYLNFKKMSAYKGDAQAVFAVEMFIDTDAQGNMKLRTHTIDQAFAQRLGPEAADLSKLFKSLTQEQIARIVSLEGVTRAQYMDSLFTQEGQTSMNQLTPSAGGPGVQTSVTPPAGSPGVQTGFVPPTSVGFGGTAETPPPSQSLAQPPAQTLAPPPAAPAAFTPPAGGFTPPSGGFGQAQAPAAPAQPSFTPPPMGFTGPGGTGKPASQLDDSEFVNMVRPKK